MDKYLRQAAEMALEQIELSPTRKSVHEIIQALRQALAEPETATLTPQEIYSLSKQSGINFACDSEGGWSGLTDDEISNRYTGKPHPEDDWAVKRTIEILEPFVRAIEARYNEKNHG